MSAPVVLFASAKHEPHPRAVWDPTTFVNIDDTVRGGSSSSSMTLKDASRGIDFSGFLDTTTLGGAGFASQAYSENGRGFPGNVLDKDKFSGLQLVIESPFIKDLVGGTEKQQPGGGKHPVTAYVLNLKTEIPQKRPDGRNESTVVYEWAFNMTHEGPVSLEAKWNEFKPKYRGRPADDAKPLDPSEVREMSVMARSNFAVSKEQSGPFSLRLVSLSALPVSQLQGRGMGSEARQDAVHLSSPAGVSGSGEYYGFALFIVATVVMALWVVWALVPDWLLQRVGVDWYPNREWAFLIPAWSLFAVLFVYAAFISLNIHNNASLDDLSNVVDSHSNIAKLGHLVEDGQAVHPLADKTLAQTGGVDGPLADDVYDLPPGLVSRERHDLLPHHVS